MDKLSISHVSRTCDADGENVLNPTASAITLGAHSCKRALANDAGVILRFLRFSFSIDHAGPLFD